MKISYKNYRKSNRDKYSNRKRNSGNDMINTNEYNDERYWGSKYYFYNGYSLKKFFQW